MHVAVEFQEIIFRHLTNLIVSYCRQLRQLPLQPSYRNQRSNCLGNNLEDWQQLLTHLMIVVVEMKLRSSGLLKVQSKASESFDRDS